MVSDSELIDRLREFLSTSDLDTTTTATVRRKLEEDFGIDLSDRKKFIREQVDLYLETQQTNDEEIQQEEEIQEEEQEEEDEEEEEEDEEEEETNGNSGSKKRGSKRKSKETKKRRGGGGFCKVCSLSPQLQKFTGVPEMARTEVVKQIWSYIRENNLQEPTNRRNILCDKTLHDLFKVDSIDMFQMNKALAQHIWPLDADGPVISTKAKPEKAEREDDTDEPKRKGKKQKKANGPSGGGTSGIHAPVPLSDALMKFLGTGENALPRHAVIKRIWDYIKQNNLQDPSDKRNIICDEKLKELFDVDTFTGFTVSKLLTAHFIKT